jgi:thiamine-phosphate pyrophosphorylase
MNYSGIYAITDDNLLPERRIYAAVEDALQSGISILQYRSKKSSATDKEIVARKLQELCQQYAKPLIINDDIDLCSAIGAAGVHLGDEDENIELARDRLGADAIIGCTCHASLDSACTAEAAGASYVAFGRFYASSTKPGASSAAPEILVQAKRVLSIPVVAIGGINAQNGAALLKAGADMLAVVHAIFGSEDVIGNTRQLLSLFEN